MMPSVLSEKRVWLFLLLISVGLVQSASFVGLTYGAKLLVEEQIELSADLLILVLGAIVLLASGRFFERVFAERFAQHYVCHLREQIFLFTLRLPAADRELINSGGTVLRLTNDMSAIRNWIVQGLAPLVVLGIWLTLAVIGLLQIHWLLAAVLLPCLLLAVLVNYLLGNYLYQASEETRRCRGHLIRSTTEKLRQFYLIKAFNQQGKEGRKFQRRSVRLMRNQVSKARMSALLRGFNELILLVTIFGLFLVALTLQQQRMISAEAMAVMLTASLYLLSQLRRLSRLYELWTLKRVAEDKLKLFLYRTPAKEQGKRRVLEKSSLVKLRHISVRGRFRRFSATLEANARVQLNGQQGSGKSSLLLALAGLLSLNAGRIVFYGRDSVNMHPSLWSKLVSLVSPELPLLRGSLRSNLFYGVRHKEPSYTRRVLGLLRLDDLDLNLRIEETGSNLSDSLCFRIRLARALLRRPRLLLIENDPALQSRQLVDDLASVCDFFAGAIVIAAELPGLQSRITAYWDMSAGGSINAKRAPSAASVVPLRTKFTGGNHDIG